MANEKFSEFTAGNPEILVGLEAGDNVQMTVGANKTLITDPNGKLSTRLNYKVYTALLTQSDTDAPTAIVSENTLGGAVVWTREGMGVFRATSANAFTANKTFVFPGTLNSTNTSGVYIQYDPTGIPDFVELNLLDINAASTDQLGTAFPIKILVYY